MSDNVTKQIEDFFQNHPEIGIHHYILDEYNNPIKCSDIIEWGKWFDENRSRRILCRTYITPDLYVSTVFLCTDHGSLRPNDKPILWETAVMGWNGAEFEGYERYESREEAMKGHLEVVEKVRREWQIVTKGTNVMVLDNDSE